MTQAARLERRQAALGRRVSMSPPGPAPDRLRVASWNLNSLRARLGAVDRFLERARPDVLCLQETKARAAVRAGGLDVRAARLRRGSRRAGGPTTAWRWWPATPSRTSRRPVRSVTSTSTASRGSSPAWSTLRCRCGWRRCTSRTVGPSTTGTTTSSWASSTPWPSGSGSGCSTMRTCSSPATSTWRRRTATCSTPMHSPVRCT